MPVKKTQKVRYEFFTYSGQVGVIATQINVKIENPASVKFIFEGAAGSFAVINKTFLLSPVIDTNNGTAVYPSELILNNNLNEIDTTIYQLLIGQGQIILVCKYYIND